MTVHLVSDLRPYATSANVSKETTIRDMAKMIASKPELHYLCVVDEEQRLIGLISRKRLFQAIFSHHMSVNSMVKELYSLLNSEQATDLLITHIISCRETDSLDKIIKLMLSHQIDAIPVLNKSEKLDGIITVELLIEKWLKKEIMSDPEAEDD